MVSDMLVLNRRFPSVVTSRKGLWARGSRHVGCLSEGGNHSYF